jgi:poly-gamma-glutamate capsule biosynthesis protein CapA/YwtB (metallophosphatase superfamily)
MNGFSQTSQLPDNSLTIAAVGDIMMGTTYPENLLPPNDGAGIFESVKDAFQGSDIVFGNLEGPLVDEGITTKCKTPGKTCYAFKTPTRYVAYLREAGFTILNIANNHASDFGTDGIESTLRALCGAGIQYIGGKAIAHFEIKGKRTAIVGFSYFDSPYSLSMLDIDAARKYVRELKASNDLVIVSFHGGAEGASAEHVTDEDEVFLGEERGNVVAFAKSVIDAGADLVIGHGPHVLRALEVYKDKLIIYSLGNFLTYERFNLDGPNGLSVILKVRLDTSTGNFIDGYLVPVKLVNEGIPVRDPKERGITLIRKLTKEDNPGQKFSFADDGRFCSGDGCLRRSASAKVLLQWPLLELSTGLNGTAFGTGALKKRIDDPPVGGNVEKKDPEERK